MKKLAGAVLLIAWFSSSSGAGEALRATLETTAYGYSVQVGVNGVAITVIKGGEFNAVQLFATDHPQKAKADPRFHYLFCLRPGRNTIKIHYEQTDSTKPTPPLSFDMKSPAYTTDVFTLRPRDMKSGTIETEFEIHEVMPQGFRTQRLSTKP